MTRIKIAKRNVTVTARLGESATAGLLISALPLDSVAQVWGDEVYFPMPVDAGAEDAQADLPSGTVAYWPPAQAICLFFGQKPYSPVNVIGPVEGDPKILKGVNEGDTVSVERA